MKRFLALALAGVGLLAGFGPAAAQGYPNKPIRLLCPFDAGSATDIIGRIFAEHFKTKLGQPAIVENKPGAGGIVALQALIDSPADGYTLYLGNAQTSIYTGVMMKDKMSKPFEVATVPIAQLSETPSLFLITQKDFAPKTFKEFIEHAKANPGKVRYGMGGGIGSFAHMWVGKMEKMHGLKFTHIPVQGGTGKIMPMMLVGDVQSIPVNAATASGMIKDPLIKAVAVMADKRVPEFPDVPTFAEIGYPEANLPFWTAMWAPAGIPSDVLDTVRKAANEALTSPELIAALKKVHVNAAPARTADATNKFFTDERASWTKLMVDIGLDKK
jgi:tripartite-type tricarboxylate transporter receptor subunit TctC